MACSNIQKNKFISAFVVIDFSVIRRIARIAQVHKVYTFYYTPIFHVKTRDYSLG